MEVQSDFERISSYLAEINPTWRTAAQPATLVCSVRHSRDIFVVFVTLVADEQAFVVLQTSLYELEEERAVLLEAVNTVNRNALATCAVVTEAPGEVALSACWPLCAIASASDLERAIDGLVQQGSDLRQLLSGARKSLAP